MPINQNIQSFYGAAQARDFARDFLFRIVTSSNTPGLPELTDADFVYVTAAKLPGRSIHNSKVPYMGLDFNVPGTAIYDNSDAYDIELYLDSAKDQNDDLRVRFETASRDVFNDRTSTGDYNIPGINSLLVLSQLDKNLEPLGWYYNLVGAQIRKINALDYKIAEGKGEVMKMGVSLSYHYYTVSSERAGSTRRSPIGEAAFNAIPNIAAGLG